MRRMMIGLFNLLLLAALVAAAWWAWQAFTAPDRAVATPTEVLDIDKRCRVFADSGQCVCRHRRTGERLSLPYDECVERARNP